MLCKVLVEAKSVEAANPVEPPLCLRQPVTLGKPSQEGATSALKGGVGVVPLPVSTTCLHSSWCQILFEKACFGSTLEWKINAS